jgi:chromosome segregation ATPase
MGAEGMDSESMALLQQIDRKNQMFGQLSHFLEAMQSSEPSTEQWKHKLEECDTAKARIASLEAKLEAAAAKTRALEEEKVLLSECIEDMEGDTELLRSQMENEALQAQKIEVLAEGRRNELARSLNEATHAVGQLRKEMAVLQQKVEGEEQRNAAFATRCVEMEKQLAGANAMVEKLSGVEASAEGQKGELQDLRKVKHELTEKLAATRESLGEANRLRQEAANANAGMLTQLQIKTEKTKDLAERCERMEQNRKTEQVESLRVLDKTREDLMSAMAEAMAAKQVHTTVVGSKDVELAALKEKVEHFQGKEHDLRVLQASYKTSENEKYAMKSEIAALKKEVEMFTQEVEDKDGTIKRLANVEQVGALSAKTVEEQQAQLQQMKSEIFALTDKYEGATSWKVKIQSHLVDLCTKMEVADVSTLSDVVLENKERLQNAEEELRELQHQLEDKVHHAESREQELQINTEQLNHEASTVKRSLQCTEEKVASQAVLIQDLQSKIAGLEESKDRSTTELTQQLATAQKDSKQKLQHVVSQLTKQRERSSQLEHEKLELLEEAEHLNKKLMAHLKAKGDAEMELSKVMSELGGVRQEVAAAEDRVASHQESIKQLNATLLGHQRAQTKTVSKESMDEMEAELTTENQRLAKDCRLLGSKVQELEADLALMERDKKKAEVVATTKRSHLEDAMKMIASLKLEAENFQNEQQQDVDSLEDELNMANAKLSDVSREREELYASLQASTKLEQQCRQDQDSMRAGKRELAEKLRLLEKAHAKLQVECEHAQTERQSLLTDNKTVRGESKTIGAENEKLSTQLSELRRKEGLLAADLRRQLAELQMAKATTESELAESKAVADDHDSQLQRVQTQANVTINGLMEQIQSTEKQADSDRVAFQREAKTLKEQLTQLEKDMEHREKSSKNSILSLRKEGEDLRNSISRMKSELRTSTAILEAKRRDAETEAASKEGKVNEAERKLRLVETERDRAVKEASDIRSKFDIDIRTQFEQEQSVDGELKRLRAQNNRLSMENDKHLRDGNSERFKEELSVLQKQVAHLEADKTVAEKQLQQCEKDMEELQKRSLEEKMESNMAISKLRGDLEGAHQMVEQMEASARRPGSRSAGTRSGSRGSSRPGSRSSDGRPPSSSASSRKQDRSIIPIHNSPTVTATPSFSSDKVRNMNLNSLVLGDDAEGKNPHALDPKGQKRRLQKMKMWSDICQGADANLAVARPASTHTARSIDDTDSLLNSDSGGEDGDTNSGGINVGDMCSDAGDRDGSLNPKPDRATPADPWEEMLQRGPVAVACEDEMDDDLDCNPRLQNGNLKTSSSMPTGIGENKMHSRSDTELLDRQNLRSWSAGSDHNTHGEDLNSSRSQGGQSTKHSIEKERGSRKSKESSQSKNGAPSPYGSGVAVKKGKQLQGIIRTKGGTPRNAKGIALPKI